MTSCIRIATREDAEAIYVLRQAAYAASGEFRLTRPDLLQWDEHDDQGVVLAAVQSGEMLSTTRGMLVNDGQEAQEALTCTVDLPRTAFPALVLSKGATRKGFGKSGLHSALRYYFLEAVCEAGFPSVLGLVYEGAPRTNLMQRLGYRFERPAEFWDPEADALKQPWLAVLDFERIAPACEELRTSLSEVMRAFPWEGPRMELRKAS
jgi:hypothetical protein